MTPHVREVWLQFLNLSYNLLGATGALIVIYGFTVQLIGETWKPGERFVFWAGPSLTLMATAVTAATIYFPTNLSPPWRLSKWFVAPIVILTSCSVLAYSILTLQVPNAAVVTGFGILSLSLSGALMRLTPRYYERVSDN